MTDLTHTGFHQSPKELAFNPNDDWVEPLSPAKLKRANHTKAVCDKIITTHEEPTISVSVNEGLDFVVPSRFGELAEQIRKSAYILEYEDNWDDEGSIAYSKITFSAAINFTLKYSKAIWEEDFVLIDAPKILPGPKGSIDLLWDKQSYRLLLNIHPHPKQTVSFYGDNRAPVPHIKGDFYLSDKPMRAIMLLLLEAKKQPLVEFPKEQIPDEHNLFMRIHKTWINEGEIIPRAFDNHNGGMSTNWSKYADAHLTKEQGRIPSNYGVVELSVGEVRDIPNQEVDHDPLPENQAHTNVIGEKDEEARLKLMGISEWAISLKTE